MILKGRSPPKKSLEHCTKITTSKQKLWPTKCIYIHISMYLSYTQRMWIPIKYSMKRRSHRIPNMDYTLPGLHNEHCNLVYFSWEPKDATSSWTWVVVFGVRLCYIYSRAGMGFEWKQLKFAKICRGKSVLEICGAFGDTNCPQLGCLPPGSCGFLGRLDRRK